MTTPRPRRSYGRKFEAAEASDRLADWLRGPSVPRDEIRAALESLRARSRDLWNNNSHVRGWSARMVRNVVGEQGVQLQSRAALRSGAPDTRAARRVEQAWVAWSRRGVCTPCGEMALRDVQALALESILRDGEALLRFVFGGAAGNDFGFAVQVLDAAQLDHTYDVETRDARGREIVMGVERTQLGRPLAYYIRPINYRGARVRVSASQIVHAFRRHYAGQARGLPWLHAAMADLRQHGKYREAELVAARIGASKVGFYVDKSGNAQPYDGEEETDDGLPREDLEPGSWHRLPPGVEVAGWTPDHPNAGFPEFDKAILRGIAAASGTSYVSFANDLEGVSYSSIRQGTLDERDTYRDAQRLLSEHVLGPIFDAWLDAQGVRGDLPRPPDELRAAHWQARGWPWVDPAKEAQAAELELKLGLTTLGRLLAARGEDLEDTIAQRIREREMLAQAGLSAPEAPQDVGEIGDADGADDP